MNNGKIILFMVVLMCLAYSAQANDINSPSNCYTFSPQDGTLDTGDDLNNLTLQRGAYIVTDTTQCRKDSCVYFNGSSYAVSNKSISSSLTSNHTISAWVKFNTTSGAKRMVVGNGNLNTNSQSMGIAGLDSANVGYGGGGSQNKDYGTPYPQEFTLITFTYNHTGSDQKVKSYVNQTFNGSQDVGLSIPQNQIILGMDSSLSSPYLGWVDEIAIWDYVLSSSEVAEYYTSYNGSCGNSRPDVENVSITPLPINSGTQAKGHWNYSDINGDLILSNETLWYVNGSLIITGINNTLLNAPNVTIDSNVTFSARVQDKTHLFSPWVNSSTVTVGDFVSPTFKGNRTSSLTITEDTPLTLFVNVSDAGQIASVIVEVENPNQQKNNLTMSLFSGTTSDGEWSVQYTPDTQGVHRNVFYAQDGSGNRANTGNELTFTATAASTPTTGGGGGGGGQTIIQNGNSTPMLFYGTTEFSFTVFSAPSEQIKSLKFENRGNGALQSAKVTIIGDASRYITAKVCETPEENCKTTGITLKAGETAFLVLDGKFERSLRDSAQGIVRITEEKTDGKTFDLLISADRPLIYGVISKVSNSEPYMAIFGENEFPALVITYLGFSIAVVVGFLVAVRL